MSVGITAVRALPVDDRRGTGGMLLFILTEAMLFLMFFFAYYYLGRDEPRWPTAEPPKLHYALPMLAILIASSVVLWWSERVLKEARRQTARLAVGVTILLGLVFLVLQAFEFREHLRTLRPTTDAYGSIFYTLTSFHAAHVVLGLLMLGYVLTLPYLEPVEQPPHRPLRNASLYWHFVDLVWVFIVALLYVTPNLTR
jgi:heme/copper-type cytochrome/quinol oxidase subunit 3